MKNVFGKVSISKFSDKNEHRPSLRDRTQTILMKLTMTKHFINNKNVKRQVKARKTRCLVVADNFVAVRKKG